MQCSRQTGRDQIRTRFTLPGFAPPGAAFCAAALLAAVPLAAAEDGDVPRTASGRPDLTGVYDIATLTPLERDPKFGDNLFLTPEEAEEIASAVATRRADALEASDPTREAPPPGGDGSPGAAGNVGGYNDFWLDYGSRSIVLDGRFRTSLVFDPPNGRLPKMKPAAQQARMAFFGLFRENTGTAWWLDNDGPGPYDDMEQRPLGERCVLGFGSTSGPPMLPTAYNNLKRVVQTEDHVMILAEMIHDARIIRIGGEHLPEGMTGYMGDSIGRWEGDTLVVETRNFGKKPGMYTYGAGEGLNVIERFSRIDERTLNYNFTVEDPNTWEAAWGGEFPWPAADGKVYEYACHEGNYAMGNIMRGARLLEADAAAASSGGE